ncbi:carcinoembryonic antigen-related cell adhesion molecule 1-like, partial [Pleurodeles waltl]
YIVSSSAQNNGPQFTGRESGRPDGSLRITDLRTSDSGIYTVSVIPNSGPTTPGSQQLRVYEILSQPSLLIASGIEFNGYNMTLKCEARNQTVDTYLFLKDNVNITCDQQRVTCTGSSPFLHFQPIMTSDNGNYTCGIYNLISNNTSSPREIWVKEPISSVNISSNGTSGHLWEDEGSVNLTCSALGTAPTFSWTYNGTDLPKDSRYQLSPDGSSLVISPVTRGDTGPFVCTASNPANNQSSLPLHLKISLRPSGRIQCRAQKISDSQVELSCSWPGGSPSAKVHLQLPPSINSNENDEVKRNVSRSNINPNMTMTCRGEQEGYSDNCSLSMGLPHDPATQQNNTLTGGQSVTLTVNLLGSSSSRLASAGILPANFTWINGTSTVGSGGRVEITSNDSFSQMVISNAMESDSGDYICRAENLMGTTNFSFRVQVSPAPETSTTQTTTTPLVTHPNDNPGGLSAGAIAGIVIGVIAVVVIIGVTVYCVLKKKKDKELRTSNR